MCYHSRRREALARLEHETGLREAADRTDRAEARELREDADAGADEEHCPERAAPDRTRRPEPVGFA
ncbi:hypothetical protein [Halobellus rufus]|uniref:hypothetical protein n=1 Tax=Halobellus rufus TaxID=1448860 RepID=UPI0012E037B9|nr:hypothetical protein [Halobellus rufus]